MTYIDKMINPKEYILELLKNNIDRVCTDECSKKLVLKQVQELSPKLVEGFL